MKRILLIILLFTACKKNDAPIPDLGWELFESAQSLKLNDSSRVKMEGIYTLSTGNEFFGNDAAVKWSYKIEGGDTVYKLSMFIAKNISYIICEGRRLDSSILLSGYWRAMQTTGTGTVQLSIAAGQGGAALLNEQPFVPGSNLIISGSFGEGANYPDKNIKMSFNRPLYHASRFLILAHRGGGRNADLLPASENSIAMMETASSYGANGIEMDVRLTSDNVPVIYHDETLNERCVQPNGLIGPIANYSYTQLSDLVRLINGEKIPTLREALDAIVYNTPLEFVWLDTKNSNAMQMIRELQREYLQKAAIAGRHIEIMIGLPVDVVDSYISLSDHDQAPAVCEPEDRVRDAGAEIWGASWSQGLQTDAVAAMHAEGRRVIVWTIDEPQFTDQFLHDGNFDGILTNYPSYLAYKYYAHE